MSRLSARVRRLMPGVRCSVGKPIVFRLGRLGIVAADDWIDQLRAAASRQWLAVCAELDIQPYLVIQSYLVAVRGPRCCRPSPPLFPYAVRLVLPCSGWQRFSRACGFDFRGCLRFSWLAPGPPIRLAFGCFSGMRLVLAADHPLHRAVPAFFSRIRRCCS